MAYIAMVPLKHRVEHRRMWRVPPRQRHIRPRLAERRLGVGWRLHPGLHPVPPARWQDEGIACRGAVAIYVGMDVDAMYSYGRRCYI